MRVVFRVDSSYRIGSGHVMRCLNLAFQIKKRKHQVEFVSRTYDRCLNKLIAEYFPLHALPKLEKEPEYDTATWLNCDYREDIDQCQKLLGSEPIDLLIVDHYGIDKKWEGLAHMQLNLNKLMVIDDLVNRPHICDFLLDTAIYLTANPYLCNTKLVSNETRFFLGPQYALLHECFFMARAELGKSIIKTEIKRVHICFGGSDMHQQTSEVLNILLPLFDSMKKIQFDIVFGAQFENFKVVKQILELKPNFHLYQGIPITKMCELLKQTDLCIGAGGTSSYERCMLGIPSIVITLASNQVPNTLMLKNKNTITYLGQHDSWKPYELEDAFRNYFRNPKFLSAQSEACYELMKDNSYDSLLDQILN